MSNNIFSLYHRLFSRALFTAFLFAPHFSFSQAGTTPPSGNAPVDGTTNFLLQLPMFIGIFFIFYLAIIRPQRQVQKKQSEFLSGLSHGQDVVTSSGIVGTVVGITDKIVTLDISEGTEMRVLKSTIQGPLKDSIATTTKTK
jgi:preprotein translocase subunit YajC